MLNAFILKLFQESFTWNSKKKIEYRYFKIFDLK